MMETKESYETLICAVLELYSLSGVGTGVPRYGTSSSVIGPN
jgi:hypothetical protein